MVKYFKEKNPETKSIGILDFRLDYKYLFIGFISYLNSSRKLFITSVSTGNSTKGLSFKKGTLSV